MNRLLFSEPKQKDIAYMREHKGIRLLLLVFSVLFVFLAVLCHILGEAIVAILPWLAALLLLLLLLVDIRQGNVYLLIYEHEIRYQSALGKTEKILSLSPCQYKIKLRSAPPKSGYTVKLIFLDTDNRVLFTYKAVSLHRTQLGTPKAKWETELFHIGCEIIDDTEFILNT